MTFVIQGIGTKVPKLAMSQEDAATLFFSFAEAAGGREWALRALFRRSGVTKRHSVLLERADGPLMERQRFYLPARNAEDEGPNTSERMARFEEEAIDFAAELSEKQPETGSAIKTLPILAGFAAYQHWWNDTLRSNFIVSGVQIDNASFQPDDAYKRTIRASTNLFWSPTPRVDVAAEFIWGQRTNRDGQEGDASQVQFATKYRF
mgnify:CR=1 FL=1